MIENRIGWVEENHRESGWKVCVRVLSGNLSSEDMAELVKQAVLRTLVDSERLARLSNFFIFEFRNFRFWRDHKKKRLILNDFTTV